MFIFYKKVKVNAMIKQYLMLSKFIFSVFLIKVCIVLIEQSTQFECVIINLLVSKEGGGAIFRGNTAHTTNSN